MLCSPMLFWPIMMVPLSLPELYQQHPRKAWLGLALFGVIGVAHLAMLAKPAIQILTDRELGGRSRILEFLAVWFVLPSMVLMLVGAGFGFGLLLIIMMVLGIDREF